MKNNKNTPLTMDSTISELYQTPVGHDLLKKLLLQTGFSEKIITSPIVGGLKLKTLCKLAGKKLDVSFFEALLKLINSETGEIYISKEPVKPAWWKEAVFYQIYPRSFYDSNGDGIGDLRGIIEKLDYLKALGVDALWLSPVYDSPNDDNGYDIRDYYAIQKEFGTMEDFDELLSKVHKLDMHLIMDLVVNHTSDEHAWFQEALKDKNSPYHDYYFFREAKNEQKAPNNWTSFFSGSAWNYYPEKEEYALHLFSKKQMDLNWENEKVRDDVIRMVDWWLSKGVDGFRMDVINYISKEEGLPEGNEAIGTIMEYTGVEHYFYGPHLHEYLHQIKEQAFLPHQAFSVGETPGLGMNMCRLVTGEERRELDMVFSFDHLETPGHVRMEDYQYDLNYYRDYIIEWLEGYGNNCWMSLFYNNHDNPRMVSKVTKDPRFEKPVMKLLALMQLTLKGTPFLFQGDEMGLKNYSFTSMSQITDVEAKGYYEEHCKTESSEQVFQKILAGTREHARVLLPFNQILPACHEGLKQQIDEEITEWYQELLSLRKADRETFVYGDFHVLDRSKNRFVFERKSANCSYLIDCNLGDRETAAYSAAPEYRQIFPAAEQQRKLAAYEAVILCRKQ